MGITKDFEELVEEQIKKSNINDTTKIVREKVTTPIFQDKQKGKRNNTESP